MTLQKLFLLTTLLKQIEKAMKSSEKIDLIFGFYYVIFFQC